MEVALRRMRPDDISQVIEIEHEAFSSGWVGTQFKRELNSRYCRFLVAYHTEGAHRTTETRSRQGTEPPDSSLWGRMVQSAKSIFGSPKVEGTDSVAGYVGIWFQGDQAHITEVAVRGHLRGRGIGELLIIGTVRAAYEEGLEEVTLEARVSNFIAQRLYDKYGFNEVGIRKHYYADNREDAVIMTTDRIHTEPYREKFADLQQRFFDRYGDVSIEI